MKFPPAITHQTGECFDPLQPYNLLIENGKLPVDTFSGRIHVQWDPQAAVTPLGRLPFFIEFLKLGNLFDPWVEECPLKLTSPNGVFIILGCGMLDG